MSESLAFKLFHGQNKIQTDIVQAVDTYIPLGPAAEKVLPSVESIIEKSLSLLGK